MRGRQKKWRWHFVDQGHASQPPLSILNGIGWRFYCCLDINLCEAHHSMAFLLPLKVCFDRKVREEVLHIWQRVSQGTWGTSIKSDLSRTRGRGHNFGGLCLADPMTAFKHHDSSISSALTTRDPNCQDPSNLLVLKSIQWKALLQLKNVYLFDKWPFYFFSFQQVNHLCFDLKHQKIYIRAKLCVCTLDEIITDQLKSAWFK